AGALVARTQPHRHALRSGVGRIDAVDHRFPAEHVEGVIHRGGRRLGGVTLAPGVGMEGPAELVTGPAFRPPRAALADPQAGGLVDDGEHAETLYRPGAGHLQEAPPGGGTDLGPADVPRRDR